jgi:hypothetical protein
LASPNHERNGDFAKGNKAAVGYGRPRKSRSINDYLRRALAETPTPEAVRFLCDTFGVPPDMRMDIETSENVEECITRIILWRAQTGDMEAFKEIFDRRDPKPRRLEVTGRDGGPIAALTAEVSPDEAARVYHAALDTPEE